MKRKIRIGTRNSALAQVQTSLVAEKLRILAPDTEIEILSVTTSGDRFRNKPIVDLGDRGVFVKELEESLLLNEVDLVSHSLKDLPTDLPSGLALAAVFNRIDPRDVLVSKDRVSFLDLPAGARIATSSRRRAAQLKAIRNDLEYTDIRGNVPTRVSKMDRGACDATILAAAGLIRLGLQDRITEYFPIETLTPAVGQGALAIECRQDDKEILELIAGINDRKVMTEISCERTFLDILGGGCSVPAGALCTTNSDGSLVLSVCVAALDGSKVLRTSSTAPANQYRELGISTSHQILKMGADEILDELKKSAPNMISAP